MTEGAPDDGDRVDDPGEEDQGSAFADIAIGTVIGGATGIAGYAVGGPGGAIVANAATPFLFAVSRKVVGPFWEDRKRRSDRMLETAAEEGGLTPEELADRAAESEESRFLTDKAIRAAGDMIWPEGVRAIGRAYAAGLLGQDGPSLDIRLRVLGIMEGLDELHVRLLALLVKSEPERFMGSDLRAVPHALPSYRSRYGVEDAPDDEKVWRAGRRNWAIWQITELQPGLEPVISSLLGELQQCGLIQENDIASDTAKRLGDDLMKQVNDQAKQMQRSNKQGHITLHKPTTQPVIPTWSPTELGEKVLGFYAEAAGGVQDQGDEEDPGQETGESAH